MDKDSDIKPIIISAVIIANIIMNTLTIAVMLKYPVLREDCSALFMFSLTLSDLAMGCISMPISAAICSRATPTVRHMTTYLPEVQLLCIGWFTVNSLYSLCWMTVSKMVALLKPLHYEQILSRKRCYGIIAFNWLFGVAVAATKLNNGALWNMHSCTLALPARGDAVSVLAIIVNGVSIVVPSIVLIYATVRIVRVVIHTHRAIASQVNAVAAPGTETGAGLVTLKALHSARNVIIICLMMLLLTLPILVVTSMVHFVRELPLMAPVLFIATWLLHCNTFVNSLLYLVLFRSVRTKTNRLFTAMYRYVRGE